MLKREGAKVRDNTTTDATFNGLDAVPRWDSARIVNKNSISFVEVPFTFTDGQRLTTSISPNIQASPTQKSASCLLISANSQGAMTSGFMSVTADNDFLSNNGTLNNFSYRSVPAQFKGIEVHYNVRGNFINGWHFNQGKIDGKIQKSRGNAHFRTCQEHNYCVEIGRSMICVGGYCVRTIIQDCSYSLTIGFCNGWFDYEWNTGGNNGGGNSYGGNINNEWGDSCDETCQEGAMVENIVDHLTHPCLVSVLQELRQNAMVLSLKAFSNQNPNVTLSFREGPVAGGAGNLANTVGSGRNYTITIDYSKLTNATDLSIAALMLHESLHAYIGMYLSTVEPHWLLNYQIAHNIPAGSEDWETLFAAYAEGKSNSDAQHLQMISTFRVYIRDALMSFRGNSDQDFSDICSDLSWIGLDHRNQPNSILPQSDKDRITNRIKAELLNQQFGQQYPVGTKRSCD
jgi:hypothetical protein